MKRLVLSMALLLSFVMGSNAQIAIEHSKAFDNVSLGVTTGVSTPLDFNSMFPLNYTLGLRVQKDFTPIFGLQLEGTTVWNNNHFSNSKTAVAALNVGLNGVVNWSNVFCGYRGTPRFFEVSTVTGLGWMHQYESNAHDFDFLTAKTGFDLAFNIGEKRAHSIVVTPAVIWNLSKWQGVQFDQRDAQLSLTVSYVYHFKTTNGTHAFKIWDVGAMQSTIKECNDKINEQRKKLTEAEALNEKLAQDKADLEDALAEQKAINSYDDGRIVVTFAQNSAELTQQAKSQLDRLDEKVTVDIIGTASPEGTAEYNKALSEKRALAVKDYLAKKGVTVNSVQGKGVADGETTNRLTIIVVKPTI